MSEVAPLRGATIELNLKTEFDQMCGQLLRLINQVEGQWRGANNKTSKIQKEWYGGGFLKDGLVSGSIWFSVTNRTIFDKECNIDNPDVESKDLVYSLRIKQTDSDTLGTHFTSMSVTYASRRGEFENHKVDLFMYGGSDVESALLIRTLMAQVAPQLEAFNADETTLIARNTLALYERKMHYTNSGS